MIKSLHRKKGREQFNLFVVEGEKLVAEALNSDFKVQSIYVADETLMPNFLATGLKVELVARKDMEKMTAFTSPSPVLAIVKKPKSQLEVADLRKNRFLILDSLRDPGNLGTIIRTADWFGIHHIVLSNDSVDVFNHKVLQSTMGSFFRTHFLYTNLGEFLHDFAPWRDEIPVYGAVLGGEPMKHCIEKQNKLGALVIGSESHGISEEVLRFCSHKITIPGGAETESLNAAVAASIILYEWQID